MPFVHRDADGAVLGIYGKFFKGIEEIDAHDPEVRELIYRNLEQFYNIFENEWILSDLALACVLKDLTEIVLDKMVFTLNAFTEAAQQKLCERHGLQDDLPYDGSGCCNGPSTPHLICNADNGVGDHVPVFVGPEVFRLVGSVFVGPIDIGRCHAVGASSFQVIVV